MSTLGGGNHPGGQHRALRELLGAYALQQLHDPEQTAVRDHLQTCWECTAELESLHPVVAALHGLDPDLTSQPSPPNDLEDRVLQHIGLGRRLQLRRTRVKRLATAALAAASIAIAFGLGSWAATPPAAPPVIAVSLQLAVPGVSADAGLVRHTWGTELKLEATGLTDGGSYTVAFVRDNGSRVGAGSFLGTGAKPVRCSVNAALPLEEASRVQVSDAAGKLVMAADLR